MKDTNDEERCRRFLGKLLDTPIEDISFPFLRRPYRFALFEEPHTDHWQIYVTAACPICGVEYEHCYLKSDAAFDDLLRMTHAHAEMCAG